MMMQAMGDEVVVVVVVWATVGDVWAGVSGRGDAGPVGELAGQ